jgi:hypothetical protein
MTGSLEDKPAQTMATAPSSGRRQTASAQRREGHQHELPDSGRSTTELKAASATPLTLRHAGTALSDHAQRKPLNEMMLLAIDRILESPPPPASGKVSPKHFLYGMSPRRAYTRYRIFTSKIFRWRFLYEVVVVNAPREMLRHFKLALDESLVNDHLRGDIS